jgi:hypothetical protein
VHSSRSRRGGPRRTRTDNPRIKSVHDHAAITLYLRLCHRRRPQKPRHALRFTPFRVTCGVTVAASTPRRAGAGCQHVLSRSRASVKAEGASSARDSAPGEADQAAVGDLAEDLSGGSGDVPASAAICSSVSATTSRGVQDCADVTVMSGGSLRQRFRAVLPGLTGQALRGIGGFDQQSRRAGTRTRNGPITRKVPSSSSGPTSDHGHPAGPNTRLNRTG